MRTLFFSPMRAAPAVSALGSPSPLPGEGRGEGMKGATAVSAVLLVLVAGTAFAQTAPTVSNVRAAQRGDGSRLVDIHYDLAHNAACTVWAVVSGDGGVSWSVPAMTLTGDLGHNVASGTNKHVIWDAGRDIPGVLGSFRARVYADDGQTGSNMVVVPAGLFGNQIFVNTFLIDKYEVTNQRYAEFLNDADRGCPDCS